ncbi:MAG: PHP domain-containing protein [Actinomycetes bacterium]
MALDVGRGLGGLQRVAFLLERELAPTYRVKAFRGAAATLADLPADDVAARAARGTLTDLPGIGPKTAAVFGECARGGVPEYLANLEAGPAPDPGEGAGLLASLRGDLHVHSDWSDGGSPIREMAQTAAELGHDYAALTDHSPNLKVANGLSPERLRQQLDIVDQVNAELAPFRLLTGIEVDILQDGSLDQEPELLARLDVVVGSVHSKLRSSAEVMTRRMVTAIANPHLDVLGHCTGRMVSGGRKRPESEFEADLVFEACRRFGVAVEINCRPERLDPPRRLISQALAQGCLFAIDTDAHAPGQLGWQAYGSARAAECGVPAERVLNTWSADDLLRWCAG